MRVVVLVAALCIRRCVCIFCVCVFYRLVCIAFERNSVLFFCAATGAQLLRSHPTVFRCQTVTNCGEGALASCLDMEPENVEETACGSGGMDGCRRAWPADKESDSCYWAVG